MKNGQVKKREIHGGGQEMNQWKKFLQQKI